MKKLLIAVMLICFGLLMADPIPIGDGEEINTHIPMEPLYNYTYSQVIYTAEEIGGAVTIENVAWHYNGGVAFTEDCVIYMGHTSLDEFGVYPDWISLDDLTEVYAGSFSVMDFEHWVTIELTNQFEYNGTDNLVIAFDNNTLDWYSSSEFFGTATTLNRSIYYYDDSINPDPANPPETRGYNEYDEMTVLKTGKTRDRYDGVQAYIANIILNNDVMMPSGIVSGHVYEDGTTNPVEGAEVTVGTFASTTDAAGFYEIEIFIEGNYTVTASAQGYFIDTDEVTVVFGETQTIDLYLAIFDDIGDTILDPIVVDGFPYFLNGDLSLYTDYSTGAALDHGRAGKDIYFQVDLTEAASAEFHCCGSDFDTYMNLYDDQYALVSYNDDGCDDWGSGDEDASWLGEDDDSFVVVLGPGRYYIAIEGFSSGTTYEGIYEAHFDLLPPPTYGSIDGTVTDEVTEDPIAGADVTVDEVTVQTDESGYYLFDTVEVGLYNVTVIAEGYFGGMATDVEVTAGANTTVDFSLAIFDDIGDTILDPIVVDGFPYFMAGDLSLYTDYSTGAALDHSRTGKDIYFQVDLTEAASAEFHCCGSDFDTYMNLYDDQYALVTYNDDGCSTWGSGSGNASWLGEDDGSYVVVLGPGRYYIAIEGYSSGTSYEGNFEAHYDLLPPPDMGAIDGTVTDDVTEDPIVGANVTVNGITIQTDESGYYLFDNLEVGLYDVAVTAEGYFGDTATDVEVVAETTTTVDFSLVINDLEGDLISTAFPIDFVEDYFFDEGNLADFNDDYDLPSLDSADAVYELVLTDNHMVNVSLQGSDYDTKVAVYADGVVPGEDNYLYYNDDYTWRSYGSEITDWVRPEIPNKETSRDAQSAIYGMDLSAGTYYIIVDGYNGLTGNWDIEITLEEGCEELECVGTDEGEALIPNEGEDVTNGGCNMDVPTWGTIDVGETICGMSNTYTFGTNNRRDMDWYLCSTGDEYDLYSATVTVDCDFGDAMIFLVTNIDCDNLEYTTVDEAGYCSFEQAEFVVPAGTYGIIVTSPVFTGYEDGWNYALTVEAEGVASGNIAGFVTDSETEEPIEGAEVTAGGITAITDASGAYDIAGLLAGLYDVTALAEGYLDTIIEGVEVFSDQITDLDIALELNTFEGDLISTAFPIDFVENYFFDEGNLANFNDDYDLPTLDSADAVYELVLTDNHMVNVSLQGSDYDTKVAVYADGVVPGEDNYLYYNDDYTWRSYGSEITDWVRPEIPNKETSRDLQSAIYGMDLSAGTYYIIVDGYDGDTGNWDIEITLEEGCEELECVGTDEGEALIPNEGEDVTNGGCNMDVPTWGTIDNGETICGMSNTYTYGTNNRRDMDWYLYDTGDEYDLYTATVTVDCDFGDAMIFMVTDVDCDNLTYTTVDEAGYCSFEQAEIVVPAGTYGIIVTSPVFTGYEDGWNYALTLELTGETTGSIAGFVTDSETEEPLEGAEVTAGGFSVVTDASGAYEIVGLIEGTYDVTVIMSGYEPGIETGVEVTGNTTTTVDFALVEFVGVVFEMTVDSYYDEASWNVWDVAGNEYLWETDWTFSAEYEAQALAVDLPDGDYEVHCWDTWGDGGIAGVVSKEGVVLASWASTDYTTEGAFPFSVVPIVFGSLEGNVTDDYNSSPIAGATIVCGSYETTTDASGNYSIPEVLAGTYAVSCAAPDYAEQVVTDVVISEGVATVQDFALVIVMQSPRNLVATVDGYDVGLTWDEPVIVPENALYWDDTINNDAIGLTDGGTFSVAVRFTPTELAEYDGQLLENVFLYINDMPSEMTLYVWSGTNAANVLLQQAVTPVAMDWNIFTYNTPVQIDASDELWIGYEVTHLASEYPAGCDAGPAVAGYGDMITTDDGATWDPLSSVSTISVNWNIWGEVVSGRGNSAVLARPQEWHPEEVQIEQRYEFATAGIGETVRDFTDTYKVYRNEIEIATVGETLYNDLDVDAGNYEYYVTSVYDEGESPASEIVEVTVGYASATVDPELFDVVVAADGTAEYELAIGNEGDLGLEYSAEIIFLEGRAIVDVYPQGNAYWTGTTDYSNFIENSLVDATPGYEAWMNFDVSSIPNGAIINSIECAVYVNDTNYPYWSITPCTLDPLTTSAADLANHIVAGNPETAAYSYNNETSTFATGWHTYTLTGTANADLEAALSDDWFAVGVSPRDTGTNYYTIIDGWNEANPPYLVVDYSIPIYPWVTFGGELATSGVVAADGEELLGINFDAAGLEEDDVMTGQILLTTNDAENEEIIVPVTMTVGIPFVYGDVTGDDVPDAYDAANILQFYVGMDPSGAPLPWTWQLISGDVDGNGSPESYDAALILQYNVGMIDEFPVESRVEAEKAVVDMSSENGELIFTTSGNLYGFSVSTDSELISFGAPEVEYLNASNGNAVALANAEAIEGEFLRIPFELKEETGEITFTMTSNGISEEHNYNVEDLEGVIKVNAVLGNYPNPFNPTTEIKLQLKEETAVRVNVYNVKGQLVKNLVSEIAGQGSHSYEWKGLDNSNRPVSSGVYFYKVEMGSDKSTHKMIMLK